MKNSKKLIILVICLVLCSVMSGCASIPEGVYQGIDTSFNQRVASNSSIVEELYTSGLITSVMRDNILSGLQQEANSIIEGVRSGDRNVMKDFSRSIVGWTCLATPPGVELPCDDPLVSTGCAGGSDHRTYCYYLTSCLPNYTYTGDLASSAQGLIKPACITGNDPEPIELVTNSDDLDDRLGFEIYVLNEGVDIAEVMAAVSMVDINKPETFSLLTGYFHTTDQPLIDVTDPDFDLIQESKGCNPSSTVQYGSITSSNIRISLPDEPGTDMPITQAGHTTMRVRLIEFNRKAFENIKKEIKLGNDSYLMDTKAAAAYMLQYPVGYIDGFEIDTSDNTFEANIKQSNLYLNIKTGDISKEIEDGNIVAVSNIEPYLRATLDKPESSSFIIYGETGLSSRGDKNAWDLTVGCSDEKVSIPRIVLMDYLEAVYSPGVV